MEQACASSALTLAVDRTGRCCGISKQMGGLMASTDIPACLEVGNRLRIASIVCIGSNCSSS